MSTEVDVVAGSKERGAVTVLAIMLVVAAIAMAYGVTRVGTAAFLRTQAENAADAAALAAADQLALGHGPAAAERAAREIAAANDAVLVECSCEFGHAEVVVRYDVAVPMLGFPEVQARARAEVGAG